MKKSHLLALKIVLVFYASIYLREGKLSATERPLLLFRENKGQVVDQYFKSRTDVLYSGTTDKLQFHLKRSGISYQVTKYENVSAINSGASDFSDSFRLSNPTPSPLSTYRVDIDWLGANKNCNILAYDASKSFDNYYNENASDGILEVRSYQSLLYEEIYSGIDLKWYSSNGNLKYDYIVKSGADYKKIKLQINGATDISCNTRGELVITFPETKIIEQIPSVIQDGKSLKASWKIENDVVSFNIDDVDPTKDLIIDPLVRLWGTYFGGADVESGNTPCNDIFGNVFLTGQTKSTSNIATTGAYQTLYGGSGVVFGDAYLVKYDSLGLRQWSTYYGSNLSDVSWACVADTLGNVYMVGGSDATNSLVISSPGAFMENPSLGSGVSRSAFIAKFNSNGQRLWGTFYGGSADENFYAATVDPFGNLYVAGRTRSANNISTPGAHQLTHGGAGFYDALLVKFDALGNRLWATYYGGISHEEGYSVTTDSIGNVYMCGYTQGSNPVSVVSSAGSHQPISGAQYDAYLVKFDSSGTRQWGTYYGGAGDEYGYYVTISKNSVFLSGSTTSTLANVIATPGSFQANSGGGIDAFICGFNLNGQRQWASYYGGTGDEPWSTTGADDFGNLYITGRTTTSSGTAIATPCTYQDTYGGGQMDIFLAKFSSSGDRIWGTYYGGTADEFWSYVLIDSRNNLYMAGQVPASTGTVIASTGSDQPSYGGGQYDAFLVKFGDCVKISPLNSTPNNLETCKGTAAILSTTLCTGAWYNSMNSDSVLFVGNSYTTAALFSDTTFYLEETSCGTGGPRAAVQVSVNPLPNISIVSSNSLICYEESATLTATGANSYTWNNSANSSTLFILPVVTWNYTVTGTDNKGCINTATFTQHVGFCAGTDERTMEYKFFVKPNPSHEQIIIYSDVNSQAVSIEIINASGQMIYKETETLPVQINFNAQPRGLYFVNIKQDGKTSSVLKLVRD